MSQGTRAANQDSIDQVVIDTPTPVTDDIKCIVEEMYEDLNEELEEPLVDPVAVLYIKNGFNITVRVRHGNNKYIDVKINNNLLMDFNECSKDDPMQL